jgi:hypothetical protein
MYRSSREFASDFGRIMDYRQIFTLDRDAG